MYSFDIIPDKKIIIQEISLLDLYEILIFKIENIFFNVYNNIYLVLQWKSILHMAKTFKSINRYIKYKQKYHN